MQVLNSQRFKFKIKHDFITQAYVISDMFTYAYGRKG